VAFGVFAVLIKYNPLHHSFEGLADIGDGTSYGLITYYKIFAPFQLVIALLTQYLFVMPLWDRILKTPKAAIGVFTGIALICLVLALSIAFMIWDAQTGTAHFLHISKFMTAVQLFYWLINFAVLFLLDIKTFFWPVKKKEAAD